MITDEQFEACRIAANESYRRHKNSARGQIVTPEDDWEWHFVRELIALAQEVKPLDFERQSDGTLLARHPLGYYEVFRYEEKYRNRNDCTGFSFESHCYISKVKETEDEAIEAANIDFRKRALSCLVNGGV